MLSHSRFTKGVGSNLSKACLSQGDGYARDNTLIKYLDNITAPLLSYTYCHRLQMFYTRPRMYISTYAFNNEESNELYSEYHLGRAAFR